MIFVRFSYALLVCLVTVTAAREMSSNKGGDDSKPNDPASTSIAETSFASTSTEPPQPILVNPKGEVMPSVVPNEALVVTPPKEEKVESELQVDKSENSETQANDDKSDQLTAEEEKRINVFQKIFQFVQKTLRSISSQFASFWKSLFRQAKRPSNEEKKTLRTEEDESLVTETETETETKTVASAPLADEEPKTKSQIEEDKIVQDVKPMEETKQERTPIVQKKEKEKIEKTLEKKASINHPLENNNKDQIASSSMEKTTENVQLKVQDVPKEPTTNDKKDSTA